MSRMCRCGRSLLSRFNPEEICFQCQEDERQKLGVQHVEEEPKATGNLSGLCKCGCGERTPIAKRTRIVDNVVGGMPLHFVRGHGNTHRGRTNGNSKLTERLVLEMRRAYAAGGTSYRAIAKQHGLSEGTARAAIKGESWSHVTEEAA